MTKQREPEAAFVRSLHGLVEREDRGSLAALRRGLGHPPGAAAEAYPYVVPWLPGGANLAQEDAYFLVASMFALWHQGGGRMSESHGEAPPNLGASLAALVQRSPDARDGVQRRFVALLNARREDLPHHLRHAVAQIRGEDVAIDWGRLLRDVLRWDRGRQVQRAWGRSFWGAMPEAAEEEEPEAETEP